MARTFQEEEAFRQMANATQQHLNQIAAADAAKKAAYVEAIDQVLKSNPDYLKGYPKP